MSSSMQVYKKADGWQAKLIAFVEALSNIALYLMTMFVLMGPPLKWITDFFKEKDNGWWVLAAAIVFVVLLPMLVDAFTHKAVGFLHRARMGEVLPVIFRPMKSVFAVTAMYGVASMVYGVMHSDTDLSYWNVIFEGLKAL